jgi:hypothetical protein
MFDLLDTIDSGMDQLKPSQRVAPRRSGHAAFVVDKIPYVFGGYIEEDA